MDTDAGSVPLVPDTPDQAAPAARPPLPLLRLALVGVVGGLLSGLFGVGGGILMVPLLIGLAHMDQRRAAATSLVAILPTAVVGSVTYGLNGQVDLVAGLLVALGGVVGAKVGTLLLRRLPLGWLRWMFVALLVVVAVQLVLVVPSRGAEIVVTPWAGVAMVLVGVLVGITAGLFGIGGGVITVPALIMLFGAGDLVAKGTSLLVIIPTAVVGTWSNLRGGLVDLRAGAVVGLTATLTSFGGVALAFIIPAQVSSVLFAVLVLGSAIQLAIRAYRLR